MNPVALITGASRGIGRGIALALGRMGFDLVINFAGNSVAAVNTAASCADHAKACGRTIRAEPCQADVRLAPDRQRLVDFTRSAFGRLDLLVNNAGVAPAARADILEATEESFDRLIDVNVKGPYFLTQLAARWMIEQVGTHSIAFEASEASNRRLESDEARSYCPKIITISSVSAYAPSVNRGDYCISNAALSMVTPLFAT